MFRSHTKGCHFQILYGDLAFPSVEHDWVEKLRDRLEEGREAKEETEEEEEEGRG